MISKTASYTIVIFAAILFIGAVFYFFVVLDFKSNGDMFKGRLLPEAASPQEKSGPEAPKISKAPEPKAGPVISPPAPRPVAPTTETTETTEAISLPTQPQPEQEGGPKTYIVSIESNGFNPKLVTITVGDTVRWVNNNSKLHWPASDPHPTHTGLPDFDPFADLLPGETFSYTFKQAGAFSYHDHTQAVVEDVATLTGVVRVLEK